MSRLPPLPPPAFHVSGAGVDMYEADQMRRYAELALAPFVEALRKIAAIEDQMFGTDWEEIDQAREIARAALEIGMEEPL